MPFNDDGTFTPVDETTGAAPQEEASVSGELDKLLSDGSPLLENARTRAAQTANQRGLLNSSMAVQAGEQAAIETALPIASQDAGFRQQENLQGTEIQSREDIAREGFVVSQEMQDKGLLSQKELQATDLAQRTETANLDRDVQERIALFNVAAHDREKATAAAVSIANTYGNMFQSIAANENIPADVREKYLTHISVIRDSNINLLEQLYNFNLEWAQTPEPEVTP